MTVPTNNEDPFVASNGYKVERLPDGQTKITRYMDGAFEAVTWCNPDEYLAVAEHALAARRLPATNNEEREALRIAIGGVLFNAMNYPEKVAHHILGQDMGPLNDKLTDAVCAVLAARRLPVSGDDAELLESLKVAMLGTTDGDFIDPSSEIPAGEMLRLAAEWVTERLTLSASQPREVTDWHDQFLKMRTLSNEFAERASALDTELTATKRELAELRAGVSAALGGGE